MKYQVSFLQTRNQYQEENLETQHPPEQPVDHGRNERELGKYLDTNENENTGYQNIWDTSR